jgi:hypothetical protein
VTFLSTRTKTSLAAFCIIALMQGSKNFKKFYVCYMCWRLPQIDTNTVFNPVPPRQSDFHVDNMFMIGDVFNRTYGNLRPTIYCWYNQHFCSGLPYVALWPTSKHIWLLLTIRNQLPLLNSKFPLMALK